MLKLKPFILLSTALNATMVMAASHAIGQTQPQTNPQTQQQRQSMRTQTPIYGYQLMTPEERTEYRNKMRSLKTEEEREQFRIGHHEQMKIRAKERGVTLPDKSPTRGRREGMGQGMGPGPKEGGGPPR
jgi:hypothetical protein